MRPTGTLKGNKMAMLVRMLCMVALVFLSFAHRPVSASPIPPIQLSAEDLAALTLPDGTVADLCLNDHVDDHGKTDKGLGQGCEACRIGAGVILPQPADLAGQAASFRILGARPLVEAAVHGRRFQPGAPPTAPPHPSI